MSKSVNSPTARLLQSSRLFSLPRPLPQPTLGLVKSDGTYRASETATTPYPVYQAIATPSSSHYRGDWGLKRPLPARQGRSTTPHIRVKGHDNFAHVTDFESAADHTLSEAKWRQMGVPLVVQEKREHMSGLNRSTYSAYDEHLDNTDPEAVHARQMPGATAARPGEGVDAVQWSRWKHNSPYIAGMQEGEFEIYLRTQLQARKGEFREFMIKRLVQVRVQDEERTLRDRGERRAVPAWRRKEIFQEINGTWAKEEKKLRDDFARHRLVSELSTAIQEFLDLPGVIEDSTVKTETNLMQIAGSTQEFKAPPTTHPAAGLSHLRSGAIMENHPFWGPQAQHTPVLARVLRPRSNEVSGNENRAKLGVGGFVAVDTEQGQNSKESLYIEGMDKDQVYLKSSIMTSAIDPDLPGGNKIWVHPGHAEVDSEGRVKLQIGRRGEEEAVAVARNDVESIHQKKWSQSRRPMRSPPPPGTPGNANYGFGLPRGKSFVESYDRDASALDELRNLVPRKR